MGLYDRLVQFRDNALNLFEEAAVLFLLALDLKAEEHREEPGTHLDLKFRERRLP